MAEISEGYKTIAFLIGSGGLTTIVAAWLGWRSHRGEAAKLPPTPIQIESPWLVQNLLTMARDVQAIRTSVDSLTSAISTMSVQINTLAALLGRRRHDRE